MELEDRDDREVEREDVDRDPMTAPPPQAETAHGGPPLRDDEPGTTTGDATSAPLLEERDAQELRRRWEELQTSFVDEPREAVQQADRLVDEVVRRVSEGLASRRSILEARWSRGEEASTEDLRLAMQSYRSFFERMLTTEIVSAR